MDKITPLFRAADILRKYAGSDAAEAVNLLEDLADQIALGALALKDECHTKGHDWDFNLDGTGGERCIRCGVSSASLYARD
jgi:ATP-dependent protease HslVU (ClpYQ) peptidase subunit